MVSSPETSTRPAGIDPRGPRVAAGITAVLLLVGVFLSLIGTAVAPESTLVQRVTDPAFLLLLLVIDLLFVWGFTSPRTWPWAVLFRAVIRPRLSPPAELEDPRPPRFAQVVGFIVVLIGVLLHVAGVPWALPIAGAAAFVAAFLNSAFGYCLGCQLYLLFARAGLIRPRGGLLGA
ncbi:DUF4395 domain-containing protein [Microbacterium sp.]|uniref:DUF4395 domain-containing protein n=1 Tax=Microbacterium sp. TaxID=51671 RepID=UPI00092A9428|nr:DUF4395 domain-containing protein [Microbacterium sp.]MBN9183491.1 DUF4395 domain-containing protein [Microbacterium sp.]MBN9190392.1 DUF4395 domain-containing protein [Microbacterium sp.]MBN9192995.1 DUF4395 domain-containing protein [Microbacterium sp.]OJU72542.1 MAG: hypothetical protein BGO04_00270 [Microbacterium sp. 70-38]